DTAGPDTGAVPKVGGAPGGGAETVAPCGSPRHATAAPSTPSGAVIRNCLRVFMSQPEDVDQQTASGPPHRRRGRTLLRGAACHIPARRRMPKIADNSDSPSNQRFARVLMYAFTTSYTYSWHASPILGSYVPPLVMLFDTTRIPRNGIRTMSAICAAEAVSISSTEVPY